LGQRLRTLNTAERTVSIARIFATPAGIIIVTSATATATGKLVVIMKKSFATPDAIIIETRVGILTGCIIETTIDATREVIIGRLIGREATIVRPRDDIFATDLIKPC
jgi:hypothetical protein